MAVPFRLEKQKGTAVRYLTPSETPISRRDLLLNSRKGLSRRAGAGVFLFGSYRMNIPAIQKFCAALPHATGDMKWGADQVCLIGGKISCVASLDTKQGAALSFKVDADLFPSHSERYYFIPAHCLTRAKWLQIMGLKKVSGAEQKQLIKRS